MIEQAAKCWWGFVGFCGGLAAVAYVGFMLLVARFVGFNDIDEIHGGHR